jgi:tubulin-specific chaperone A
MFLSGRDEADIKKQEEVLLESISMIPDCQRRLVKAYDELEEILQTEEDLKELEEFTIAMQVLEEAKLQLPD